VIKPSITIVGLKVGLRLIGSTQVPKINGNKIDKRNILIDQKKTGTLYYKFWVVDKFFLLAKIDINDFYHFSPNA
jgi:hypothetical protein